MSRTRLLYLGHVMPYPPDTGPSIRAFHTLRILAEAFDITALCFYRASLYRDNHTLNRSTQELSGLADVSTYPLPQEQSRLRMLHDHVLSLITRRPYTWYVYDSRVYRQALRNHLAATQYDVIHVESLDLCAYLGELDLNMTVLTHHNVESELLRKRAVQPGAGLAGRYMKVQAELLEREERRQLGKVRLNVTVSDADARALHQIAPNADILVMPNGVDVDFFTKQNVAGNDIVFIGGMEWFPNVDAMQWFGGEVLPLIRAAGFKGRCSWIGRATEAEQRRALEQYGIVVTGYVDDIRVHVSNAACVVVPLRIGGGTRLKITTAWALGKPVVSTTIGCEGLNAHHDDNIILADTALEMSAAVLRLLHDTELRRRIGESGRVTAETDYAWPVVGQPLLQAYRAIARDNR